MLRKLLQMAQNRMAAPTPLTVPIDLTLRALTGELHLPPLWLRDVGPTDFAATGREFLELFIRLVDLRPDEQVLEIGCGCGRIALPLTGYLQPPGGYTGMDVVARAVAWCQQHISPRFPHFRFIHMDLFNQRYNPAGQLLSREYVFPFEASRFDFIFLTSVFTHMLPDDVNHYMEEISRLLKPGGRALITAFLLNETQQKLAQAGQCDIDFRFDVGGCFVRDRQLPEAAVAYEEPVFMEMLTRAGLKLRQSVAYGSWSGRGDGVSYQDILVVERR
ncbi:MAG: class I SAM-dependent methyltransferase [Chloroflexi bacterium]|nr:MAG: class I SAM-dependent methyltransferase [Chloroflexota bacterium]